ncbi:MAG: putative single-stranded DNA-binding protein [Prokaryotic dsDNA virus sp.]|nr:MAG: putative single-stranded DNA-binding protein [Prokaryotic dsDNA virus sp.]|tara:strand:+ start:6444 stop:6755 length:312 start_codon:yes stop_codon:yes gene_type:complete
MSLNKIHIIGNVGRDPEEKATSNGNTLVHFNVAVSSKKQGNPHTQWFYCKAFNNIAMYISKHVQTGTKVYVEGSMESNDYQGKTYWNLMCHKVLILDGKKETP